ncbi:unnamed protein product, partial [Medioppia subpectinata]
MHNRCLKYKTDVILTQEMSQNYPKDSLDRFGDDMCEHILSYLTLEDRFRCECVSKQWRRLIYTTQTDFMCTYSQTPFIYCKLFVDYERIIRALLHKCVNLSYIEIRDQRFNERIGSMLDIIADCFHNPLNEISLPLNGSQWEPSGDHMIQLLDERLTEQIPSAMRKTSGLPLNQWIKHQLNRQYANVKLSVKL